MLIASKFTLTIKEKMNLLNTFLPSLFVVTLATWTIVDIWLYGSIMQPFRDIVTRWETSQSRLFRFIGHGLNCGYCVGHWVVAFILACTLILPNTFSGNLTIFEAILLVPIAARLSIILRDNCLMPVSVNPTDPPTTESNVTNEEPTTESIEGTTAFNTERGADSPAAESRQHD